jgi:hypothetical protein
VVSGRAGIAHRRRGGSRPAGGDSPRAGVLRQLGALTKAPLGASASWRAQAVTWQAFAHMRGGPTGGGGGSSQSNPRGGKGSARMVHVGLCGRSFCVCGTLAEHLAGQRRSSKSVRVRESYTSVSGGGGLPIAASSWFATTSTSAARTGSPEAICSGKMMLRTRRRSGCRAAPLAPSRSPRRVRVGQCPGPPAPDPVLTRLVKVLTSVSI